MLKRFLILLATLTLVSSFLSCPAWAVGRFSDVCENDWFTKALGEGAEAGIIGGYPDGTFRPDRKISSAEFIRIISRGKKSDPRSLEHWAAGYYYKGLEQDWYTSADIGAAQLDRPIARKYIALIYSNILAKSKLEPPKIPSATFPDIEPESPFEYPIARCAAFGVLSGYRDGAFRPEAFVSRAEAISSAVRFIKLLDEGKISKDDTDSEDPKGDGEREDTEEPAVFAPLPTEIPSLLREILETSRFCENGGKPYFTYSMPDIPRGFHLSVRAHVYGKTDVGTPTLFFYMSDEGHMSDPQRYDPSAKTVKEYISTNTLSDKSLHIYISIYPERTEECKNPIVGRYALRRGFDGAEELYAVFIPQKGSNSFEKLNCPKGKYFILR